MKSWLSLYFDYVLKNEKYYVYNIFITLLQQMISYYWFYFELRIEITFLLTLSIYCETVVDITFLFRKLHPETQSPTQRFETLNQTISPDPSVR